jgi:hypothetical protein
MLELHANTISNEAEATGLKRIDIVYFDAGSGHRSAAKGLERALAAARPDWSVRMVNVIDVFASNRQFHLIVRTGIAYFNWMLKREKIFDLKGLINISLMFHNLLSSWDSERSASFGLRIHPTLSSQ